MPSAVSDDESDIDIPDAIPAKKTTKADPVAEEEDDDAEEEGEDEYVVEKILKHKFVRGQTHYQVKWFGYDNDEDLTWEPKENLETAPEILEAYHQKVGGTPEPPNKKGGPAGKRKSEALDSPAPKKGRKSQTNGSAEWEPPLGSWEDHVTRVAAIVEDDVEPGVIKKGKTEPKDLSGLLEWDNGRKTQHNMQLLRTKCPQRLLDYYESHLVFKGQDRYVD